MRDSTKGGDGGRKVTVRAAGALESRMAMRVGELAISTQLPGNPRRVIPAG